MRTSGRRMTTNRFVSELWSARRTVSIPGADWEWRFAVNCGQTRSGVMIAAAPNTSDVLDVTMQRFCWPGRSVRDKEAAGSNPATPTHVRGPFLTMRDGPLSVHASLVRQDGAPRIPSVITRWSRCAPAACAHWSHLRPTSKYHGG
jgi:hypothetical protein